VIRRICLLVATSIVVIILGFPALWFFQAEIIRQHLETTIAEVNAQAKKHDPHMTMVTYQSLRTSGFPGNIVVTINKPRLDIPLNVVSWKSNKRLPNLQWLPTDVHVRITSDAILMSQHIGSTLTTLQDVGQREDDILFGNRLRYVVLESSDGLTCHGTFPSLSGTPSMSTMASSWLHVDMAMDCSQKNINGENARTKALLYHIDAAHLQFSNMPSSDENRRISYHASSVNARFSRAEDAIFSDIVRHLPMLHDLDQGGVLNLMKPSKLGAINHRIDMTYDGPVDQDRFRMGGFQLRFDMPHNDFQSALWSDTSRMQISTDGDNTDTSDHVRFHEVIDGSDRSAMRRLGPLSFDFDATGDLAHAVIGKTDDASMHLKNFSLQTRRYGIALHGDASHEDGTQSIDMTLTCKNCDRMITDWGMQIMRLQRAMPRTSAYRSVIITREGIERFRKCLHLVAESPETTKSDIVIRVEQQDQEPLTISGKSMLEILYRLSSTLSPGKHVLLPQ